MTRSERENAVALAPGADDNGFACMLAGLLAQNLADHPHKQRDFDRLAGRVALVVDDIGVSLTLMFRGGELDIYDGIVGIPDVTIRGTADLMTKMSLIELEPRSGLPDLRRTVTREILHASRVGSLQVYGMLANVPLLVRLTRVMSVN